MGGQISTGKIPITERGVSCVKIGVQTWVYDKKRKNTNLS